MDRPLSSDLPTVFTSGQALDHGLTQYQLRRAVARQDARRLTRGVYAATEAWRAVPAHERHRLASAAAAHRDADAVLSHVSAALAWQLPNPRGPLPQVWLTVTGRPRVNRRESWVHLHRATLPDRHRSQVRGITLTSPARTVVDCFRSMRLGDAVAVGDAALRRDLTSLLAIEDALDGQFRWPHVTRALRGIPLLDPRRENWLESYSAAALFLEGLPLATPQVAVFDRDGAFIGRVDALWEELGVVGEADGAGKYLGDFDPHHDRSPEAVARRVMAAGVREGRLRDTGLGVVRWDPKEIVLRPKDVAGRVRAAARDHRAAGVRAYVRYADSAPATLSSPG